MEVGLPQTTVQLGCCGCIDDSMCAMVTHPLAAAPAVEQLEVEHVPRSLQPDTFIIQLDCAIEILATLC